MPGPQGLNGTKGKRANQEVMHQKLHNRQIHQQLLQNILLHYS